MSSALSHSSIHTEDATRPQHCLQVCRDSVCVRVQTTGTVLDDVVVLCQRLDPSGEYTFRAFECLQPLDAVMISPKKYLRTQQVVTEVL